MKEALHFSTVSPIGTHLQIRHKHYESEKGKERHRELQCHQPPVLRGLAKDNSLPGPILRVPTKQTQLTSPEKPLLGERVGLFGKV